MDENLLIVENLKTEFNTSSGIVTALNDISFSVPKGKIVGIVGESGCGKSVTSLSIMGLLPEKTGYIKSGRILFKGMDLTKLKEKQMEKIRGKNISMIFQEPMTCLNPVFTIGNQIGEVLEIHEGIKGEENRKRCTQLLDMVSVPRADKIIDVYPHELSGGMRQRVMIAMALACKPELIIADEPTTALDVTIQAQVLNILKNLQKEMNTSIILITHDLGVIAEMADKVEVMYAGSIVESCDVTELFDNPKHPYTKGLLKSREFNVQSSKKLYCISGMVPSLLNMPSGCAFNPRCNECMEMCKIDNSPITTLEGNHKIKCHLYNK